MHIIHPAAITAADNVLDGVKTAWPRIYPIFVTKRKRSEAALIQVVQEAFVQGVSTRKMEKLARSLGVESLSRSQVSQKCSDLWIKPLRLSRQSGLKNDIS